MMMKTNLNGDLKCLRVCTKGLFLLAVKIETSFLCLVKRQIKKSELLASSWSPTGAQAIDALVYQAISAQLITQWLELFK